MTPAIVCTALLAALVFGLGLNVSIHRGHAKSQLPTELDDPLFVAQRAHGNAAEYVPLLAVLMLLVGSRHPAGWMIGVFYLVTAGRFLHAFALIRTGDMGRATLLRHISSGTTYYGGLALAVAALIVI